MEHTSRITPRRAAAVVMATSAILGGSLLSGTAMAACPSGYHCVYKDTLDDIQQHNFFNTDNAFSNDAFANNGGIVDENGSAMRNSSSANYRSRYYYDDNQVNEMFCVNPGSYATNLWTDGVRDNGVGLNDEASSLWLTSGSDSGCF